jgi:hypothetical protein
VPSFLPIAALLSTAVVIDCHLHNPVALLKTGGPGRRCFRDCPDPVEHYRDHARLRRILPTGNCPEFPADWDQFGSRRRPSNGAGPALKPCREERRCQSPDNGMGGQI